MEFLTDPWGWWISPFVDSELMRDALLAGILTVVTTSLVGTWVVLRGMSFLGDALAHGVLPGIAIAFIIGVDTSLGALVAAGAMVGGIALIRRHSPLPDDTSIGVLFVGFLALAVVITAIALVGVVVLYRAFLVMTFDASLASMLGLRPGLAQAALLALLAISIVSSFQSVGNLLVFAFLIAPPAAASLLVRRVPMIMVVSVALGSLATVIGILVSYHHATAAGATMALTSVIIFFLVLAGTVAQRAISQRRTLTPA